MSFKTEEELSKTAFSSMFMQRLFEPNCYITHFEEEKGLFGIPDLVIATSNPFQKSPVGVMFLAFEMKLKNWKRALIQAFKYRSFAHKAYVLIDHAHVKPAKKNLHMFKRSNVGLLSIDDSGKIKRHYQPRYRRPYSQDLECALRLKTINGGHIQTSLSVLERG